MKKLNNKGFTLVELLAVVVILAVVMGIAMTSVITAMNNSRKGSLEDSAKAVANAFKTKYGESLVIGGASNVYEGVDFNTASEEQPVFYSISTALKDELNLSDSTYMLSDSVYTESVTKDKTVNTRGSFVAFDGNKVVVCLIAVPGGNYYVANAASNVQPTILDTSVTLYDTKGANLSGKNSEGEGVNGAQFVDEKAMWACSNGQKSWE